MKKLEYNLVNTEELFEEFYSELCNTDEFVFDLEATSLATHSEDIKIVGIGFCWQSGVTYYVPFNGDLSEEMLLEKLAVPFRNEAIRKIGHNLKYDTRLLDRYGIKVENIYFDTMVASYSIYGDRFKHNLDDLVLHHINHVKIRTKHVIPKKSKKLTNPTMLDTPIEDVAVYCSEDVDYTYRLYLVLKELLELKQNAVPKKLFYEVDMPLCTVLCRMECNGIKLDESKLGELHTFISEKITKLQGEIDTLAGRPVALTKPADIADTLYEELKLHKKLKVKVSKTSSGQYSTNAKTLESLKDAEIVQKIIEYKMYTKLMSTYVSALPGYISGITGCIHPFFSQTRTATCRLSCSEPNVQQQPSRSEVGRKIREAYISRFEGGQILAVDYSQAELRILAHMGQEKVFLKAYNDGVDVHKAVASEVVYDVPLEEVTKEQRTKCKTVNFGILYGMRAKKLSGELNIPITESSDIMNKYLNKMQGLKSFLDNSRDFLKEHGYTENYFGRRRYIPKIYSEDQLDQWSAEREGANNVIQSTNADMIRRAMVKIQDYLDENNMKSLMILQVHDELVFDVHPDEIDVLKPAVSEIMENIVEFDVLMLAEGAYADNWSGAH